MNGANKTKLLQKMRIQVRALQPLGGWTLALTLSLACPRVVHAEPGTSASAERSPTRGDTVLLADLGLHIVAAGVQRVVTDRIALQASAGWYVPWTQTKNVFGVSGDHHSPDTGGSIRRPGDPQGGMVRLRPFFYLGSQPLRGLWVSPFIQGGWVTADRAGTSRTGPAAALGATVGYAFLLADHLHLSLGAGLQVHAATLPGGDTFPSFFQPFPTADIAIGYRL